MRRVSVSLALLLAGAIPAAGPAAAQAPRQIAEFGAWTAFAYEQKGAQVCYVASRATSEKGGPKGREGGREGGREAFVLVTHRPADKAWGEVSIVPGYVYRKDDEPTARIGSDSFTLFAKEDSAWARDEDDPRLVEAMKRGTEMVVTGTPSRGSESTDSFSLIGFTKAYEAIDRACRRR